MNLHFDKTWTLFLDRDGVINTKVENDYIRTWNEFKFIPGVLHALSITATIFSTVVVTTNQQGIGKGFYTEDDLSQIHKNMLQEIALNGGRIDKVYFCPNLETDNSECRKPNTGMAVQAKLDFPVINFSKSVMVGDAISDMQFGKRLGMTTIYIHPEPDKFNGNNDLINYAFPDLYHFAKAIIH